jgi:hypothetical protein
MFNWGRSFNFGTFCVFLPFALGNSSIASGPNPREESVRKRRSIHTICYLSRGNIWSTISILKRGPCPTSRFITIRYRRLWGARETRVMQGFGLACPITSENSERRGQNRRCKCMNLPSLVRGSQLHQCNGWLHHIFWLTALDSSDCSNCETLFSWTKCGCTDGLFYESTSSELTHCEIRRLDRDFHRNFTYCGRRFPTILFFRVYLNKSIVQAAIGRLIYRSRFSLSYSNPRVTRFDLRHCRSPRARHYK